MRTVRVSCGGKHGLGSAIDVTVLLPLPLPPMAMPQIKKAYCPPEVVNENPILDYCKHILFAWSGEVSRV